jgi:sulfate transport system substrate-binding protein
MAHRQTETVSKRRPFLKFALAVSLSVFAFVASAQPAVTLLNVCYDLTRELYVEFNAAFAKYWRAKTGQERTGLFPDPPFGDCRFWA